MKNLAAHEDHPDISRIVMETTTQVESELKEAGVELVPVPDPMKSTEVFSLFSGKLGPYTFRRAWYYWVVSGLVPLEVAKELYSTEVGKKDIRVEGNCTCPDPEDSASFRFLDYVSAGFYRKKDGSPWDKDLDNLEDLDFGTAPNSTSIKKAIKEGRLTGNRYVSAYHIDSQEGLNEFVRVIKKHGLDKNMKLAGKLW